MRSKQWISGTKKNLLLSRVFFRLLFLSIKHNGFFGGIRLIFRYSASSKSIFRYTPNRFFKNREDIFAVPDLPPVNSPQFSFYLLKDMEFVLERAQVLPLFVIFCITSRCPHHCHYCYNSYLHSNEEKISTDRIISTIEDIIKTGIKNIYLSGGEPVLRWDLVIMILETFKDRDVRFWLLTTGHKLSRKQTDMMYKKGLTGVMVSLDTYDENIVNQTKGSSDAFEDAVNAINNAGMSGLPVALNSVFSKKMLRQKEFDTFVRFAGSLGVSFINCYSPKGLKGSESEFTFEDYKILKNLTTQNMRNGKNLPVTYSPDAWESHRGCVGGKLFVYIDPAGNVKKCPFSNVIAGNITQENFSHIYNRMSEIGKSDICSTMQIVRGRL